jgi:hypothetical protein
MYTSSSPYCPSGAGVERPPANRFLRDGKILRTERILDNGFGGGGIASRLVGGSNCMLLGSGESKRCRFNGRRVNGLDGPVGASPEVCADLPAVWLEAVFRKDAPGSTLRRPCMPPSSSSSSRSKFLRLGTGSSAMAKPSNASRSFIFSFCLLQGQ